MNRSNSRIEELRGIVEKNPGASEFVELAGLLAEEASSRPEAREICLRGLSKNPLEHRGRLILAKLYYLDEMTEFCVRELARIRTYVDSQALKRLIEAFGEIGRTLLESNSVVDENLQKDLGSETSEEQKRVMEEKGFKNKNSVVAELDLDEEFLDVLGDLSLDEEESK